MKAKLKKTMRPTTADGDSSEQTADISHRRTLFISGVLGLTANLLLTLLALALHGMDRLPAFASLPAWGNLMLFFLLGGFSLAEIPIMLFSLSKLAADPKGPPRTLLFAANALYVSFAAVYAGIYALFARDFASVALLSALGLVRFLSSLFLVKAPGSS